MRAFAVLVLLAITGCAAVEPIGDRAPIVREVNERSYKLGETYTTVVGDSLVRVRSYFLEERAAAALQANTDFEVVGGGYDISFAAGQVVQVDGTRVHDGVRYYVVPIETNQLGIPTTISLQVTEDGRVHEKALGGGVIYSYRADPSDGRLLPVERVEVLKSKPFSNYEIIFNGSDGQGIRFTYREYSPDDLARTAFFQDLSYPTSAKIIRFRNLVIDVMDIDEQSITVAVRSD